MNHVLPALRPPVRLSVPGQEDTRRAGPRVASCPSHPGAAEMVEDTSVKEVVSWLQSWLSTAWAALLGHPLGDLGHS